MKRAITIAAMLAAAGLAGAQMFAQMFAATSTARLPAEYQEVEYLESSGTQYMVLPLGTITTNNSYRIKFVVVRKIAGNNGIFGSTSPPGRYGMFAGLTTDTQFFLNYGDTVNRGTGPLATNSVVILNQQKQIASYTVDGVPRSITSTGTNDNTANNFRLFSSGGFNANGVCKIYYFDFLAGDELMHSYVPCYRKSDSVAGMYDLVNATFVVNSGTGSFTVGPDVQ